MDKVFVVRDIQKEVENRMENLELVLAGNQTEAGSQKSVDEKNRKDELSKIHYFIKERLTVEEMTLTTEEVIEEIEVRLAKLNDFKKEFDLEGNNRGSANAENRGNELESLLKFIKGK